MRDFQAKIVQHLNDLNKPELIEMIQSLLVCPSMGIPTRQGWDLMETLGINTGTYAYIDIDVLKEKNSQYGLEGVNARIRASFSSLREGDIAHVSPSLSRFYSGDEFVFRVDLQFADMLAERLNNALVENELSATIVIADDLSEAIAAGPTAKDLGRDSIYHLVNGELVRSQRYEAIKANRNA